VTEVCAVAFARKRVEDETTNEHDHAEREQRRKNVTAP
jgi:hypothetical protein